LHNKLSWRNFGILSENREGRGGLYGIYKPTSPERLAAKILKLQ